MRKIQMLAHAPQPAVRQDVDQFRLSAKPGTTSKTIVIMDIVDDAEAAAWDAEMERRGF